MKNTFQYLLLILCSLSAVICNGQLSVSAATNSCNCDGSFTYEPFPGQFTFFQVFDHSGVEILNTSDPLGVLTYSGLCADVFIVNAQSTGSSATQLVQITAIGAGIGTANTATICSTSNPVNLSTFLGAFTLGGTWHRPNGTTFNGSYVPNFENGGLYYYEYTFGGCDVFTGVLVTEIQNGNAGLQTTYLICDTYDAFFMTDFVEGNPDYTGYWTNTAGVPIDGYYDPATMDSELFIYVIDNVPGCNPVYNTLFVDENSTPNPGISTTIAICDNAQPFNIFDQIPGNPDAGGFWFSPLNAPTDAIFDPNTDQLGIYRYVVPATSPCQQQQVQITLEYTVDDPSGVSAALDVCSSESPFDMTNFLDGNPSNGGQWSDAFGNTISAMYDPTTQNSGTFHYFVPNVGCSALGSELIITEHTQPNAGIDVVTEICQSSEPLDLSTFLQEADLGGFFQTNTEEIVSPVWNINSTQLIQLDYIIGSAYCPQDTSQLVLAVVGLPFTPLDLSLEYCSTNAIIDLNEFYPQVASPLWSHTSNSTGIFNPANGSTDIILTSESNNICPSSSATVSIVVDFPLFEDATLSFDVCNNDSPFELNAFIDASIVGFGEWWTESLQPSPSVVPQNTPGSYTYFFISNENGACPPNSQEIELIISDSIHAGLDMNRLYCTNQDGFFLSGLLAEGIDNSGVWLFQDQPLLSDFFDPSSSSAGVYQYVLAANLGCPGDTSEVNIQLQNPTIAEAGNDIILCENSAPIVIGSSNTPGATYTWSPAFNLSSTASANPTVTLGTTGNTPSNFEYFVTLENGVCTTVDSITITINPLPSLNLSPEIGVCIGEPITLTTQSSYNVIWSPSNLFSNPLGNQQTISPTDSQTIYLQATNEYGCSSADSIVIQVHPLPVLNYTWEAIESCSPYELFLAPYLENENVENGSWYLNNSLISNDEILEYTVLQEGLYNLDFQAESNFGCAANWNFNEAILIHPTPYARFDWTPENPSILQPEVQFINNSIGATTYFWDFDAYGNSFAVEPMFSFPTDEARTVEVCLEAYSDFGCKDSLCKSLDIVNEHVLFAPNAFTPNSDGLNDIFIPYLNGFEEISYELIIFDRWGTEIFKTNDTHTPWVGDVRGGESYAANGVYTWQIKVKVDLIADYLIYSGHVNLIR